MELTNINQIRELMTRHGFRFSKSMGQNFLTAGWVPEQIAEGAGIDRFTGVLEVGLPDRGAFKAGGKGGLRGAGQGAEACTGRDPGRL